METISNLETFAKILTAKGYDGNFLTQGAYPDKIQESIESYLKCCQEGTDSPPRGEHMLLSTYLKWEGEDKPHVRCIMYVKHLNGKFFLNKMEIARNAPFGGTLQKTELTNLSVITIPSRLEAIELVSEIPKQAQTVNKKRSGF